MEASGPYLVLVWAPSGYTLEARSGALPRIGDHLKAEAHEHDLIVTKIGSSPLPGDWRRCVYTVGQPGLTA